MPARSTIARPPAGAVLFPHANDLPTDGQHPIRVAYRLGGLAKPQEFTFTTSPTGRAVEHARQHLETQRARGFRVRDVRAWVLTRLDPPTPTPPAPVLPVADRLAYSTTCPRCGAAKEPKESHVSGFDYLGRIEWRCGSVPA